MTDGEAPRRSAGSLLPVSLYADLGLKRSVEDTADALVALALEEHFVWAGIRLRREPVAVSYRVVNSDIDRIGRMFVTNDRLDADLAHRNELVSRIGAILGIPNKVAELVTIMLELHIDVHLLSGEPFNIPGLLITGGQQSERAEWIYQQWVASTEPLRLVRSPGLLRRRRALLERLDWASTVAARPAAPYRIQLLVASDLPNHAEGSVPWTDVSLGSPPSAGTGTPTTE